MLIATTLATSIPPAGISAMRRCRLEHCIRDKQLMEKSNTDNPFERYKREGVTRALHVSVVAEVSPNVSRAEWNSIEAALTISCTRRLESREKTS